MAPRLHIDSRDARPIWRQIEEGVRHLVARGSLPAGAAVPSVRDMARELQVNPATVSKAYQRLTDSGILHVRRGEGTFVSDQPPGVEESHLARRLREEAMRYAGLAVALGATLDQAEHTLEAAWRTLSRESQGEPE
jgi:GntR family transcriptional regulator